MKSAVSCCLDFNSESFHILKSKACYTHLRSSAINHTWYSHFQPSRVTVGDAFTRLLRDNIEIHTPRESLTTIRHRSRLITVQSRQVLRTDGHEDTQPGKQEHDTKE